MRRFGPIRKQFVEEAGTCWICDDRMATDCHEMSRGCCRDGSIGERCTWLATCWECNCYLLTDYSVYPIERQLAIKWIVDREHFDLRKFNKIRGRAPTAITMSDVIPHICRELDG